MIGTQEYDAMIAKMEKEFRLQMIVKKGDYHKVKIDNKNFSAQIFPASLVIIF